MYLFGTTCHIDMYLQCPSLFQNRLEMYLAFLALYAILVPMQLYAVAHQNHHLTKVFTVALCLEPVGIFLNVIHYILFAFDGIGIEPLAVTGDFIDILSEVIAVLSLSFFFGNEFLGNVQQQVKTKHYLYMFSCTSCEDGGNELLS